MDPLVKSEFFGFKKSPGTWYTLQSDMIQKICLNTQHSEDVQNTSAEIHPRSIKFHLLGEKIRINTLRTSKPKKWIFPAVNGSIELENLPRQLRRQRGDRIRRATDDDDQQLWLKHGPRTSQAAEMATAGAKCRFHSRKW